MQQDIEEARREISSDISSDNDKLQTPCPRRELRQTSQQPKEMWSWAADNFVPTQYNFNRSNLGMTSVCSVIDASEELDYFFEFFDSELMDMIVTETNRYQGYLTTALPATSRSRLGKYRYHR